jgi:hypothetical protein
MTYRTLFLLPYMQSKLTGDTGETGERLVFIEEFITGLSPVGPRIHQLGALDLLENAKFGPPIDPALHPDLVSDPVGVADRAGRESGRE